VRDLDRVALEGACRALVRQHSILTTVIHRSGETPYQTMDPVAPLDFQCRDLPGADEQQVLELARKESKRPFAIEGAPLLRVRVFRWGAEAVVLVIVHHIIFDGTSASLLVRALFDAYGVLRRGG